MNQPAEVYYSPKEAGAVLGVSAKIILTAIRRRELDAVHYSAKTIRVSRSALLGFVTRRQVVGHDSARLAQSASIGSYQKLTAPKAGRLVKSSTETKNTH